MRIKLIAVGTKMPSWVNEGFKEYQKRLNQDIVLELQEIPAGKRGKNADLVRITEKEGEQMLAAIGSNDRVIALDVKGKRYTTDSMASRLQELLPQGQHISLFIGGPEGLSPSCLQRADEKWSLSDLTLPHPLVRVILAEQLYRCWSVIQGHPYHR
ncbi:MAG: 23S rRNA (pseudouridine(1915)-N(3))-methyltransferase RlmH [Moraxellaceae bacterium]|nr:MAG: 23S rRNA (pseudouridine(1915)-N(3))-methyltransferase RlmH [Moraxellaceae bacterium]